MAPTTDEDNDNMTTWNISYYDEISGTHNTTTIESESNADSIINNLFSSWCLEPDVDRNEITSSGPGYFNIRSYGSRGHLLIVKAIEL